MNQHRLIVNQTLIEKDHKCPHAGMPEADYYAYRLFYQLTHLTHDRGCLKHDDRLDAVAIAVAAFGDMMVADAEVLAKQAEDAWLLKEIQDHLEATGRPNSNPEPTWM